MKAIKFTKVALEKLKHTNKTYRVQDQQTVGLSIEVRATPSKLKVYYAEWSNIVIDKNGNQKRWGSRRKVCRYGQKPIEAVKKVVNINLDDWKKDTSQSSSKRTLTHLVSDFKRALPTAFRKASGKKIKYKKKTINSYITLLDCYVLALTDNSTTKQMLTAPYNVDGTNYYKKILADIPLTELGKRDIKIWHSRLEQKPIAANRALAALSVAMDWDSQRPIPAYKETNPCLRIAKYTENKDKAFIEDLPKVLEIVKYCNEQLYRDPQFLCFILLLLEIGERLEDCFGLAWKKPINIADQKKCSGWIIFEKNEIYLRDSKNRKDATIGLTDVAFKALMKLQNLVTDADTAASWAVGSMWVFPRPTDNTLPINNSSYRSKTRDFLFKFGMATRELVRVNRKVNGHRGKRSVYKYTNILTLKHLRKTYVTYYGRENGLEAASLRMRHSSMEVTKNHYFNEDQDKLKVKTMYGTSDNVVELKKAANDQE